MHVLHDGASAEGLAQADRLEAVRADVDPGTHGQTQRLSPEGAGSDGVIFLPALSGAMPTDTVANRQMVEVHYYDPFNFTLMSQDEVWGNQAYYWGAPNQSVTDTIRNATWGDEAYTDTKFGLMKTKFIDQGIPVILGEFGAQRRDSLTGAASDLHLQSRRYYHQYVVKSAVANGLRPFFWDVGSFAGGVFDRSNNTVSDPAGLMALQQGAAGVAP